MGRIAKPWWREESQCYYATVRGVQHRLDPMKSKATRMLAELVAKPENSLDTESALVLIDRFLAWCEKNRPDSYGWYFQFLNPFCEIVRTLRVDQVEAHHVEEFIDKDTWGPSGKRAAITAIKRAFNWGVKQGLIQRSPVKSVEKPQAGIRETIIDRKTHELIVSKVSKPFGELLELAWETGARPYELYLLETRHLEVENRRAVFPRAESKGKKKQRVVYYSSTAMEIIKRNMRDEGAVMRNVDGNPWTIHSINSTFARLQRKIGTRYCLYNWRHSFAHRKLSEGVDSMIVATWLGHSSTQMLERVYAHIHKNQEFLLAQLDRQPSAK